MKEDKTLDVVFEFINPAEIRLKSKKQKDELWRSMDIYSDLELDN